MVSVYSDGSSHSRGEKPGGWAYYVVVDGVPYHCFFGGNASTTNNVMELTAAVEGLTFIMGKATHGAEVELVSDSEYVLGIASGKFRGGKNRELVRRLQELAKILKIRTRWVKGHTGDTFNEACDKLAKTGKAQICQHAHCLRSIAPRK